MDFLRSFLSFLTIFWCLRTEVRAAWDNSQHFVTPPVVSSPNDLWTQACSDFNNNNYTCQLFLRYKREIFILGVLEFLKTTRSFPKIPEEVRCLPKTFEVRVGRYTTTATQTESDLSVVWGTSAEILHGWPVTIQIWIVFLTGWSKFSLPHNRPEALGTLICILGGSHHQYGISCRRFSDRHHFARKPEKKWNVGFFLRLGYGLLE